MHCITFTGSFFFYSNSLCSATAAAATDPTPNLSRVGSCILYSTKTTGCSPIRKNQARGKEPKAFPVCEWQKKRKRNLLSACAADERRHDTFCSYISSTYMQFLEYHPFTFSPSPFFVFCYCSCPRHASNSCSFLYLLSHSHVSRALLRSRLIFFFFSFFFVHTLVSVELCNALYQKPKERSCRFSALFLMIAPLLCVFLWLSPPLSSSCRCSRCALTRIRHQTILLHLAVVHMAGSASRHGAQYLELCCQFAVWPVRFPRSSPTVGAP